MYGPEFGDAPSSKQTFTFDFEALDGAPLPEGAKNGKLVVTIDGEGTVELGQVSFTKPGAYVYRCYEETGDAEGYTYDQTVYTVTYEVTETVDGLDYTRTITKDNDEQAEGLDFTNSYKKPVEVAKNPNTSDATPVGTMQVIAALGVAAIAIALVAAYCEQDSALAPAGLLDFAAAWDRDAVRLREALDIGDDWAWRFGELSSGQQKRLQVAVALWKRPDVLVMDEPTNHLDAPTRKAILLALRSFSGVGILISHDRDLLDALVERCVCFEGGEVLVRPGNYSHAFEQRQRESAAAADAQVRARREERRLAAERQRRVEAASRADGLRSRRGLDPRDHDAREKIGRAIVSGKDGRATHLATTLDARIKGERDRAQASYVERRYDGNVPSFGERSRRSVIARLSEGTVRYGGVPDVPGVAVPELFLGSADHVGVVGPNGSGKSTLVRALVAAVPKDVPMLYVPQEIGVDAARRACARLQGLAAGEKGQVLSVVAQLNSRPDALLEEGELSPGELRKLVLAEAVLTKPQLLVMDEPTNHLDLHSIEALERLLSDFPGAVVLVSHDARVVRSSCGRIWELLPASGDDFTSGAVLVER